MKNSSEETETGPVADADARLPLVEELRPVPDVGAAFLAFSDVEKVLLLESSLKRESIGRFSFLTADPFHWEELTSARHGLEPFEQLRELMARFASRKIATLPPFQGGAAGLLSYELGRCWEQIAAVPNNEFEMPDLAVGIYDWVIAWDHHQKRAWIISQGFPETDLNRRAQRAGERSRWVRECLHSCADTANDNEASFDCSTTPVLPKNELALQHEISGPPGLSSNYSREDYLQTVERVVEYIHAGDIFQANLSQRLLIRQQCRASDLYLRLREENPAPFSGYLSSDDWAVVSSSPERFVCLREGEVETRPIKGTRQRRLGPEADLYTRDELRQSEKDQAENVMIVDLLRNDLSRVCRPCSIRVPSLCDVETYETVQHLVTEIRGTLESAMTPWDLIRAVFPGGSITGAPKIRAMEIISELEPTVRGAYCGSLFYVGFDGSLDSSILIRTMTVRRGWVQLPVGGGIVAQSDPQAEYQETLHKAEGMFRALV